jgi:hypothetical protein
MQAKRYSPKCSRRGIAAAFGALTQEEEQMPTTATIDRDQRDGIYEVVRNHLGAIGDVWIALEENEDFEVAERLGREFGEDFRLLADIGWRPREACEAFALTMPADDLIELLDRLSSEAEWVLLGSAAERESDRSDAATRSRFQLGLDACEELLVDLDEAGRGRA